MNIDDVLRYYVLWTDVESDFVKYREKLEFFRSYLNYMKIIRNFKQGSTDYILNEVIIFSIEGHENSVQKFSNLLNEKGFLNRKISKALVASSKILWLFNQETIIMDNFNIATLRNLNYSIAEGDYEEYCLAWKTEYEKCRPEIQNISSKLKNLTLDCELLQRDWFQKRIFDMFLWNSHYQKNRIIKNDN